MITTGIILYLPTCWTFVTNESKNDLNCLKKLRQGFILSENIFLAWSNRVNLFKNILRRSAETPSKYK